MMGVLMDSLASYRDDAREIQANLFALMLELLRVFARANDHAKAYALEATIPAVLNLFRALDKILKDDLA